MSKKFPIWNGPREIDTDDPSTFPLGYLRDMDGMPIAVYRDNIAQAYADAVGIPPAPPLLSTGILNPQYEIETIDGNDAGAGYDIQMITGYTYVSQADEDQVEAANYQTEIAAWNNHAIVTKAIIDLFIQQMKSLA